MKIAAVKVDHQQVRDVTTHLFRYRSSFGSFGLLKSEFYEKGGTRVSDIIYWLRSPEKQNNFCRLAYQGEPISEYFDYCKYSHATLELNPMVPDTMVDIDNLFTLSSISLVGLFATPNSQCQFFYF